MTSSTARQLYPAVRRGWSASYLGGPVADGEEVFRIEWIALYGVDGAEVRRVDGRHLLGRRLGLAVAEEHSSRFGTYQELRWLDRANKRQHAVDDNAVSM